MWILFTNIPTDPEVEQKTSLGKKVSYNLLNTKVTAPFKHSLLKRRHKINTLNKNYYDKVYWYTLDTATKDAPHRQLIWNSRLVVQEILTGKVMTKRGEWTSEYPPWNCGHSSEDVTHIFNYHKGDNTWKISRKHFSNGQKGKKPPQTWYRLCLMESLFGANGILLFHSFQSPYQWSKHSERKRTQARSNPLCASFFITGMILKTRTYNNQEPMFQASDGYLPSQKTVGNFLRNLELNKPHPPRLRRTHKISNTCLH